MSRRCSVQLEEYDGARRRSSIMETKGHVVSTEIRDVSGDNAAKKQQVPRILGYPVSIPFIIANEFCERFSYYGMMAILFIYLKDKLQLGEDTASLWYHEFQALCYLTPILGALVADILLGKFRTILIFSIIYLIGNMTVALTSIGKIDIFQAKESTITKEVDGKVETWMDYTPALWGPLIGLHLIALGTGGIKPCVSSFGGDQFKKTETAKIQKYFSMFYASINAGSLISTAISPELRSMGCFGEHSCFPAAFVIPGGTLLFAIIAFLLASKWYIIVPPLGNPLVDATKVTIGLITSNSQECEKRYGAGKVADTKQLLRVCTIFIPFIFFWALFQQQSSTWIVQLSAMNGMIGSFELKPDQMQIFNPLYILVLIPAFEYGFYPLMKKIGIPTTPLVRMVTGMVFTSLSFVMAAILQIAIEGKLDEYNVQHETSYNFTQLQNETFPFLRENQIHRLAMIPQIFILTCGEIMCSITALEFAYAYAPESMKSVCQSLLLLSNSFGNVLVIIFKKVTDNYVIMFFMWAGLQMFGVLLIIIICRVMQGPLEEFKEAAAAANNSQNPNNDNIEMEGKNNGQSPPPPYTTDE